MAAAKAKGTAFLWCAGSLKFEMALRAELRRVVEGGETFSRVEAAALMERVLAGEAADVEIAALVAAMAARGETAEEIAGFAQAMRAAAKVLPLTEAEREVVVDTCGTGGDGCNTFNISTAAALVAAAAGVTVAKHGNRAVTSKCGSADVLEALGIPTSLEGEAAADALRRHGFVFLLAPAHHPAMKAVMPVRRALGVRTVFNLLGPLLNPAGARRQVMGVYSARVVRPVAQAMTMLDTTHAMVVHGHGGLDELAMSGPSTIAEVRGAEVRDWVASPVELGGTPAPLEALAGGDARENAGILQSIFAGDRGDEVKQARRDAVLLNAAAVLVVAGRVPTVREGLAAGVEAVDSGRVRELVAALRG